jgi:preprotein translocase subunit SecD
MKLAAAGFALLFAFIAGAAEPWNPSVFQLRLVVNSATADSEKMECVGKRTAGQMLHVQKAVLLDGSAVKSASAQKVEGEDNFSVEVTFTDKAREHFAAITRQHVGKQVALVVDGKVYCAPVIRDEIGNGKAIISGQFTEREATQVAAKLKPAVRK